MINTKYIDSLNVGEFAWFATAFENQQVENEPNHPSYSHLILTTRKDLMFLPFKNPLLSFLFSHKTRENTWKLAFMLFLKSARIRLKCQHRRGLGKQGYQCQGKQSFTLCRAIFSFSYSQFSVFPFSVAIFLIFYSIFFSSVSSSLSTLWVHSHKFHSSFSRWSSILFLAFFD